jgi:hypothetical protein
MASYAVLLALSGFYYSAPEKSINFAPRIYEQNFACFFSVDSGWGIYRQQLADEGGKASIEVRYGELNIQNVELSISGENVDVELGEQKISAELESSETGVVVRFAEPVCLSAGETLAIALT